MFYLRRLLSLALVLVLLASACGSDRGDEEPAAAPTSAAEEGGSADGADGFGDLESPCGEGDAAGATEQGITDEAIKIGFGDDAGFASQPGLGHQTSDAMRAFVDWCNDQGGILGRQVEATYYDAKVTEVNNAIIKACAQEFYLVGFYWVLDSTMEPIRRECGLPAAPANGGSALFSNAPLAHFALPNPGDRSLAASGYMLAELFPEEIKKAALVYANYPVILDQRDKNVPALEAADWMFDPDCTVEYSVTGEPSWLPFAQKLKDCGAEIVYFIGSPAPNLQGLLESSAQLDYSPVWRVDANTYDQDFANWNTGGLGDKVYFSVMSTPFEEIEENEALQQYVALVEGSGGDVATQGVNATSAFLLWATAVKACGSDLTRDCVMSEIDGITEWTAGGLHQPMNPAENEPTECSALLRLDGTSFVRVVPEETNTFDCDPRYVFKATGEVITRNNIDADRKAQL